MVVRQRTHMTSRQRRYRPTFGAKRQAGRVVGWAAAKHSPHYTLLRIGRGVQDAIGGSHAAPVLCLWVARRLGNAHLHTSRVLSIRGGALAARRLVQ